MVCTKLDAGYCRALAAPCPKKYEVKMITFRKCPNFGKAAVNVAKAKVKIARKSAAKKAKKSASKKRRK